MAYDKFNILTSTAAFSIENVDTDQIIPARFLKQPNVLVLATTFP
jgi:3-isopropylmalate/(R)-2-methylmalate dehydratase small subunit